jgi:hypothetical protein
MDEKAPTNLYTALLAAQRAMGPVVKNATNPHLKSKYADLSSVLETIEEPLWSNGLLLIQRFTHDQGGAILVTELIHAASGERIASEVPVVSKDPTDPQKIGAAITYYRRYSLLALLGLAPEDDDGHAASQPARQNTANPPPAFASNKLFTATDFGKLVDRLWQLAEDGAALARIKDELNGSRHRMTSGEEGRQVPRPGARQDRGAVLREPPAKFCGLRRTSRSGIGDHLRSRTDAGIGRRP